MRVTVSFRPRRQEDHVVELSAAATIGDLLRMCGQSPDHTLAIRGGVPVPETEALQDGDAVTLLSAFSGG